MSISRNGRFAQPNSRVKGPTCGNASAENLLVYRDSFCTNNEGALWGIDLCHKVENRAMNKDTYISYRRRGLSLE